MVLALLIVCSSPVTFTACQTVRAVYPEEVKQQPEPVNPAITRQWPFGFQQGPFRFYSDFALKAEPLMRDLKEIQYQLERQLGLKVGKRPIEVFFYQDYQSYRVAIARHVPPNVRRQALFVKGPQKSFVYAYKHRGFDTDVRHECTHALIHNSVQFIPLWMDEGLAEYFENKSGNARQRPAALKTVRDAVFWRQRISLEELERMDGPNEMGSRQYRNSWAWIHFLMNDPYNKRETRKILFDYLAEIRKGTPPGDFSAFLQRRLPDNRARMAYHFRTYR